MSQFIGDYFRSDRVSYNVLIQANAVAFPIP